MKYYAVFVGREPGVYESWTECSQQVTKYSGARFKGYPSQEEAIKAYNEYGGGVNKPLALPTPASPPHGDDATFAAQVKMMMKSIVSERRANNDDDDEDGAMMVRTEASSALKKKEEKEIKKPAHRDVVRVQNEIRFRPDDYDGGGGTHAMIDVRPPSVETFEPLDDKEYHTPCMVVDAACDNPHNGTGEYRGIWIRKDKRRSPAFTTGPYMPTTNNVMEFMAAVEGLQLICRQKIPECVVYTDSRVAMAWVNNMEIKPLTKEILMKINKPLLEKVAMAESWLVKHRDMIRLLRKWDTRKWGEIPADYGRK